MKRKNGGFSLIELIIAITILVILTGLLAPQFMKYIERAKQAKVIQTLDNINNGLQVAFIDTLTDSEDNKVVAGTIMFNRGIVMGDDKVTEFDEILLARLKSIISEEEIEKTFILITFAKVGIVTNDIENYYMSGVKIFYYYNEGELADYYYFVSGEFAANTNLGNYGEHKNNQDIKWK